MEGSTEKNNNVTQDTLRTQILKTIEETQRHPLAKQFLRKEKGIETMHDNLEKVVGVSSVEMVEQEKSDFFDSFTHSMGQYETQHIGGGESWYSITDWLEAQNLVLYKRLCCTNISTQRKNPNP